MSLRDTEEVVQHALRAGLIGTEKRRLLLEGLPLGFVYSLPTVSRPIDQLRFDLMELSRTPRLIGLARPPLAVWLENAVTLAIPVDPGAALCFARATDALLGGDTKTREIEAKIAGDRDLGGGDRRGAQTSNGQGVPPAERRSSPLRRHPSSTAHATPEATYPPTRQVVLTINPDVKNAWRAIEPRIDPEGRHFTVRSLPGRWHTRHGPRAPAWGEWVQALGQTLADIAGDSQPGDCLSIFAEAPLALGILLGGRLYDRRLAIDTVAVFQHTRRRWAPWGPDWSQQVEPRADALLEHDIRTDHRTEHIALFVELSGAIPSGAVAGPLAEASRTHVPRVRLRFRSGQPAGIHTPSDVETAARDLRGCLDAIQDRHAQIKRLHLFYSGPLALAIRLGEMLQGYHFKTVVYHLRDDAGYTPAVVLGGAGEARLVEVRELKNARGRAEYDAFIAAAGSDTVFSKGVYDALTTAGVNVFLASRSLDPGDVWDEAIPGALDRSNTVLVVVSSNTQKNWYQLDQIAAAIERAQERGVSVIPILIDGASAKSLPYGLRRVEPMCVEPDETAHDVAARLGRIIRKTP